VATVLIYSDDSAYRDRVRLAAGRTPGGSELGPVDYVEADAPGTVHRAAAAGGVDALVLDGEAWPAGGLGVCRQMKAEIPDCPPVLVTVARDADRWLGRWSHADAVLVEPVDPADLAAQIATLLRGRIELPAAPPADGAAELAHHAHG
jgi:DNA-binding response OmpR family regulator